MGNQVIAAFSNGVYSINRNSNAFVRLNANVPSIVAIGQSGSLHGDLFANFANPQGGFSFFWVDGWRTIAGQAEQIAD